MKKYFCLIFLLTWMVYVFPGPTFADEKSETKDKLQSIMIEHMEFEDASISAVVNLLRLESVKFDPEKTGVNIILLLDEEEIIGIDATEEGDEDDDFLAEDDEIEEEEDELVDEAVQRNGEKTITIMFDDLSLGEAIRNICIAADMNYRIDKHAVIIFSKNIAIDKLETRIYPVEQDAFSEMGGGDAEEGGTTSVKDYFARRGIAFPKGARIVYDNSISRLIATNTVENLRRIEQIIDELNVVDPQVLVETTLIKISQKDLNRLKIEHKKEKAHISLWRKVINSKEAETVASASVVSQNGEEATIRMVKDVYFPKSWRYQHAKSKVENKTDEKKKIEINVEAPPVTDGRIITRQPFPEFGEPTELGTRLTVTPNVDPDKYTISLEAVPVFQQHIGWSTYKKSKVEKMPIIKAYQAKTETTLYDGQTMLISSCIEDVKTENGRERNYLMLFYTATLLHPNGVPLRNMYGGTNPLNWNKQEGVKNIIKPAPLNPMEHKLEAIKVKNFNFIDVDFLTVFTYLSEECKKQDPTVNFKYIKSDDDIQGLPTVTLHLRDIPALDLLHYICLVTKLNYRIEDKTIVIGKSISDMETILFSLRAGLAFRYTGNNVMRAIPNYNPKFLNNPNLSDILQLDRYITSKGVNLPKGSNVDYDPKTGRYTIDTTKAKFEDYHAPPRFSMVSHALKAYFLERGVNFPEGSLLAYDSKNWKLVVTNTRKNIKMLVAILRTLDLEQPQVLIENTIVEIPDEALVRLIGHEAAASAVLTPDNIRKIIDSEDGRILTSQQVMSKSGEEARLRSVSEEYFPEGYGGGEVEPSNGHIVSEHIAPEFGEASDLGARFIVTPTVSPNNYTITLALNPQYLKLTGFLKYDWGYTIKADDLLKKFTEQFNQPILARNDLSANVRVFDGKVFCVAKTKALPFSDLEGDVYTGKNTWTELVNKAKGEGVKLKHVFFFIEASIVNPDGKKVTQDRN